MKVTPPWQKSNSLPGTITSHADGRQTMTAARQLTRSFSGAMPGDSPGVQPLSAAAIESAIGVVGRPVRRERVPSVPASSPFAID